MFIKMKALNLLKKLDWDITINSLLSYVREKGYIIKVCTKNEYKELVDCTANNNLLYPNSFIYRSGDSSILILQGEHSNIDILVQIAHIVLKHKTINDIQGNTGKENKEALLFTALVLRPNNSLLKAYRNMWLAITIFAVLITANICSFVKMENTRIKYIPVSADTNEYVYISKDGDMYHREFCGYVENGSVKVDVKVSTDICA